MKGIMFDRADQGRMSTIIGLLTGSLLVAYGSIRAFLIIGSGDDTTYLTMSVVCILAGAYIAYLGLVSFLVTWRIPEIPDNAPTMTLRYLYDANRKMYVVERVDEDE